MKPLLADESLPKAARVSPQGMRCWKQATLSTMSAGKPLLRLKFWTRIRDARHTRQTGRGFMYLPAKHVRSHGGADSYKGASGNREQKGDAGVAGTPPPTGPYTNGMPRRPATGRAHAFDQVQMPCKVEILFSRWMRRAARSDASAKAGSRVVRHVGPFQKRAPPGGEGRRRRSEAVGPPGLREALPRIATRLFALVTTTEHRRGVGRACSPKPSPASGSDPPRLARKAKTRVRRDRGRGSIFRPRRQRSPKSRVLLRGSGT